jgi:Ca2+-binding RTX toxin-like protein
VPSTVSYDPATRKATLNPDNALEGSTTYTATIEGGSEGVKDSAGNALAADEVWSFTTTATCTIVGTSSSETLTGTAADDVICAGAGNDQIKGLEGNDILKGEAGVDTANFSSSLAAISASLVTNSASGEGSDTLVGIESLVGSNFADDLSGSDGNNLLTGNAGADVLTGLGGADNMLGHGSNDTLNSRDGVEGNDSVDGNVGTDTCTTDATEKSILNCEQ